MSSPKLARGWFALTALVVLTGLIVQVVTTANVTDGAFATAGGRLANLLCFFTIDSNLLVGGTCLLLALGLDRPSTAFRVLRLDGLVGIAVTGIVFQVALAGLYDLHGGAAFADAMLHKVSPILCVLGWLLFGPRGVLTWRVVWLSTAFPLVWLAFTLIRGAFDAYYPYPFLDAGTLGYGRVALNCVLVGVLFTALAAGALLLDRVLAKRSVSPGPAETR